MKPSTPNKVFASGLGARDRKNKLAIPQSLVGCWRGGGAMWKLADTGVWSCFVGPHTWSVLANGQTLVWNWTLTRKYGSGTTYIGVWAGTDNNKADGPKIEISFNEDSSYQWRWVDENESTYGYYVVNGNELTVYEKRADKTVTGNQITMTTVWGDVLSGTWTLNGDNWHIDWGVAGTVDYISVAC